MAETASSQWSHCVPHFWGESGPAFLCGRNIVALCQWEEDADGWVQWNVSLDLNGERVDVPDCFSWLLDPNSSFQILSVPLPKLNHPADFMVDSSNGRHKWQVPMWEEETNHFLATGSTGTGQLPNFQVRPPFPHPLCVPQRLPAAFNQLPTLHYSLLEIYRVFFTFLLGHCVIQRSLHIRAK